MKKPYTYFEARKFVHYVSCDQIELYCFELSNIFYANKKIAEELAMVFEELIEIEKLNPSEITESLTCKSFRKLAFTQISQLLLNIAINIRTLDDQIKDNNIEKHSEIKQVIDEQFNFTSLNENNQLRIACNKIIHCKTITPLVDRSYDGTIEQLESYSLTGEIELSGVDNNNSWSYNLYCEDFIEACLEFIALMKNRKKKGVRSERID